MSSSVSLCRSILHPDTPEIEVIHPPDKKEVCVRVCEREGTAPSITPRSRKRYLTLDTQSSFLVSAAHLVVLLRSVFVAGDLYACWLPFFVWCRKQRGIGAHTRIYQTQWRRSTFLCPFEKVPRNFSRRDFVASCVCVCAATISSLFPRVCLLGGQAKRKERERPFKGKFLRRCLAQINFYSDLGLTRHKNLNLFLLSSSLYAPSVSA